MFVDNFLMFDANRCWLSVDWFMVFNVTFNNTAAISWRSVLFMDETWAPGKKSLTHFIT